MNALESTENFGVRFLEGKNNFAVRDCLTNEEFDFDNKTDAIKFAK